MTTRFTIGSFLVGVLVFIVGCNEYALDTEWRSGNYRLIAIDTRGQMSLIDTSDKVWEGVGPTVFSIGADDKFIVLAQHPSTNAFGEFNRSVTHYFIVDRTRGSSPADREKKLRGPLSKEEFDRLSTTLSLPKFSKTFNDLK